MGRRQIESEVSKAEIGRAQETKVVDAKWRGKGFTLPLPAIYRSRGATLRKLHAPRTLNVGNTVRR
jgi:hypothetical protein